MSARWIRSLLLVTLVCGVLSPRTTLAQPGDSPCVVDAADLEATIAPDDQDDQPLDGRLGGERASWDTLYGAGTSTETENVFAYDLAGCGTGTQAEFGYDRAVSINLQPAAAGGTPPATPSGETDAVWTQDEAQAIARNMLPKDAQLEEPEPADDGAVRIFGTSEVLGTFTALDRYILVDASGEVGEFQVILSLTDADEVAAIDVQLRGYGEGSRLLLTDGDPVRLPEKVPSGVELADVVEIVDGEKVRVTVNGNDEEVRLIGIDAPETEIDEENTSGECFAQEATDRLGTLLPAGKTIFLERETDDRDDNDRLWRHVWYQSKDDNPGRLLNEVMIKEGFAAAREEGENTKYSERFKRAEDQAKEDGAGLWETCGDVHVPIYRHGSANNPGAVGETLEADGMTVTLEGAFYTDEINLTTPKGGYDFLIVDVRIENVDDENHGYSDARFSAIDVDSGAEFDDTFTFLDAPLGTDELSPGEYVTGQVALEVQETAENVRVKYDVSAFGGDVLYWLVPR